VRLALWFHDAVHDTRAKDNEERSAELARAALRGAGVPREMVERVRRLVLATRHELPAEGADASLVVDVDLAILGAAPRRFAEYERQVRREYGWVPSADYRAARLRILRSILDRPAVYATAHFRDTLEERARANLARSVRRLDAREPPPQRTVPVDESALAPYNSYGLPPFVARGFYVDVPFRCAACGRHEIWRAAQQKWWYEVAKGSVESTAKLCRPCRRKEQARRADARRTHLEGLARKRLERDRD
jgi:hypothetical protein